MALDHENLLFIVILTYSKSLPTGTEVHSIIAVIAESRVNWDTNATVGPTRNKSETASLKSAAE